MRSQERARIGVARRVCDGAGFGEPGHAHRGDVRRHPLRAATDRFGTLWTVSHLRPSEAGS